MNRKGFTLIELLAVIVILAIIALIATPVILNIINSARANAKQRSAELVYTGVQYAYVSAMYGGIEGTYVANPSLEDIKQYLNVDNVDKNNPEKVFLNEENDMLTIISENGAYCEVTIENGLQVSCYSSTEKENAKHYFTKYVQTDSESGEGNKPIVPESSKDWFTYDEATGTITGFSDIWNNLEDENKYNIVIPSTTPEGNDVVAIRDGAFTSKNLTSVIIPDSVITIGNGAFQSNNITSLDLGKSVQNINSAAFYGNKLESLTIPDSVITIDDGTFAYNNLISLDLGKGVQIIKSGAFNGNKLESVTIPNSVQTISPAAFCENQLTNVTIPDSVTSIGSGAFAANNLITVELGANVEKIDQGAFNKTNTSNPKLTKIINKTGREFDWDNVINNLTLGRYTFETGIVANNYGIVVIVSGEGNEPIVQESPKEWFTYDEATGTITGFSDTWNNLNDSRKYDIVLPYKTPEGNDIVKIDGFAFYNRNLTSVIVSNSVKTIEDRAFSANGQLIFVNLGTGVQTIGESAFFDAGLIDLTIPDSVKTIKDHAFASNNLINLDLGNGVQNIEYDAFQYNNLTSVTIPESVQTIGTEVFDRNNLKNVTILNGVESIGNYAFASNKIKNVTIPDSVVSIGNSAFYNNNLTNVKISNSANTIGDYAFANNNLTNITIPNSVQTIGDYAFQYNNLTSVTIPQSVIAIGQWAFYKANSSNPNLTTIVNKTGKSFDWDRIINGLTSGRYTFETGIVDNDIGNVTVTNIDE